MKKKLLLFLAIIMLTLNLNAQDYCLQLDEANAQRVGYLTTENDILNTKLNGATDYTIEVWLRPTSTDIHNRVVLKRWNQFAITLFQDDNKRFYFTHYTPSDPNEGTTYVNSQYNAIKINEWNHLVVICDSGANTLKLYVNGVDVTGDYSSGNPTTQTALTLDEAPTVSNLYIGYGGSDTYLTGQFDKVRVKNSAETIGDLQSTITDADYVTDTNTAVLYNFNEGSGLISVNEADSENALFQCNGGDCVSGETWWVDLSTTLSSEKFNTIGFKLFPNPVEHNSFIVQAKNKERIQNIEIFDLSGKLVKRINFEKNTFYTNVNVKSLNAGVYVVITRTNMGIGTQKLIIK